MYYSIFFISLLAIFMAFPLNLHSNTDTLNSVQNRFLNAAIIDTNLPASANPKDRYKIVSLGNFNSNATDYAPTISPDGLVMYFVSNRKGSIPYRDTLISHDFWIAKKANRLDSIFSSVFNIDSTGSQKINTRLNEGAASISSDGYTLYFTGCSRKDGFGSCDIYSVILLGNKWLDAKVLPKAINTEYWEAQPSISPDNKRIFFVSDRPVLFKNKDKDSIDSISQKRHIYYSDFDLLTKSWGQAKLLECVNTDSDEAFPFLAPDGETFYFASNKEENNYGGYDFYITKLNSDCSCSTPENLNDYYKRKYSVNLPINTQYNEFSLSMPATKDIIYFASDRHSSTKENLNIYMAYVPHLDCNIKVVGAVSDSISGSEIYARITIKNLLTGRVIKDFVSSKKLDFSFIVLNSDFGNPKGDNSSIEFEITATSDGYEDYKSILKIDKPQKNVSNDNNCDDIFVAINMKKKQ